MPTIAQLPDKHVAIKIANSKTPTVAAVSSVDALGIWIEGAGDLVTDAKGFLQRAQIKKAVFFIPWPNVEWVAMESE